MARSKIIKEFVSEKISLEIALKRLIVLLDSLENEGLIKWAKSELVGYKEQSEIPSYRIVKGIFMGCFTIPGYGHINRYKNHPLPTVAFKEEGKKEYSTMNIDNSIGTLASATDNGLIVNYPPELYPLFEQGTNINVESAYLKCDGSQIIGILDNIKTKVLEILLKLEKEFGNLDELDIDISSKSGEKLNEIVQNLLLVIQDNSIKVGDKNNLKDSKLLSQSKETIEDIR